MVVRVGPNAEAVRVTRASARQGESEGALGGKNLLRARSDECKVVKRIYVG